MQALAFQLLDWDTNFFGYKIAKLAVEYSIAFPSLLQKIKNEGIKLVYWYVNPFDVQAKKFASDNSFFFADEKVTYVKNIQNYEKKAWDNRIVSYVKRPMTNALKDLAIASGVYSRFHKDPKFQKGKFEQMYIEWMSRSLQAILALDVLVYEDNKPLGVITLGGKNDRADIGLLSVDESARGKGIGTTLIESAIMEASQKGFDKIQVVTQKDNVAACALYEKMGFSIESVENIYHIWLR